ncbi:hypothetical protein D3C87_2191650 [compost metagenome]
MDDLVARAFGKRPQVEVVVFTQPKLLIVGELVGGQKFAPHERLEKTDLAASDPTA